VASPCLNTNIFRASFYSTDNVNQVRLGLVNYQVSHVPEVPKGQRWYCELLSRSSTYSGDI